MLTLDQITSATPKYTGKKFLATTICLNNPLYESLASRAGAGNFLTIGGGSFILIQRQGNLTYRVSFGIQAPKDSFQTQGSTLEDVAATRELFLSKFYAGWAAEYKDLIQHGDDLQAWDVYTLAPEDMQWKSVPGLTLAGDAAHISVIGGEGVNISMVDAVELAEKIEQHGLDDLPKAVEEYEQGMFARGAKRIAKAGFMGDIMHAEDPSAFIKVITGA
jgi:2-polyprenyl-6-methoxyphenol hydroxylase-like FAD-dependent oxidoreductase